MNENHILQDLAKEKSVSEMQIALAWLRAKGIISLPKSGSEKRLKENIASLEISLTKDELTKIDSLNLNKRQVKGKSMGLPHLFD